MLNCSTEKETQLKSKTLITSFLPRQLLINPKLTINMKSSTIEKTTLKNCDSSQQKGILLKSIAQFLDKNGFSKTLQKFLKEAHIEKDDGEISSLDIEEMCFEYLKSRNGAKKEQGSDQTVVESAKNVKKTKENESNGGKKSEPITENGNVDNADVKSKKKKSKSANGTSEQVSEETQSKPLETPGETPLTLPNEPAKKSKDKKKKNKDESELVDKDVQEKQAEVAAENVEMIEKKEKKEKKVKKEKKESKEKNASKIMEENVTNSSVPSIETIEASEKKKESKKRKKPSSEENGTGLVEEAAFDDSKRRKTDNLDQSNGIVQPPKTPNGSANDVLEKDGKEKSQKQNKTKELNGSAELGTAKKAFQRVKPEEVEFADERLQDNSYWAKDGADSGYGAKAQEVLGQVRGRDFRHEKTKKKRGSYRGGIIDQNTHSVKFNYDDEDE